MPPTSPNESIELLTTDDDGNVVEGPKFSADLGAIQYLDHGGEQTGLAYPHKFFKRGEHGTPLPETLVTFLVPDYLCDGSSPSRRALELVAERMGWSADA